jgi:hypothetical protein
MAYTYLLGWSKIGMWYYGARWALSCSPDDLWTTYFTSSKYVLDFREKHGDPDVIQIRRVFEDSKKAQAWENKVIRRLKCASRTDFLNKNYGSKGWNPNDPEIRKRISKRLLGRPLRKEHKEKISQTSKLVEHNQTWNENVSKALKGIPHTEERKAALRKGHNHGRTITCPHCAVVGKDRGMTRYHFDNCKLITGVEKFPSIVMPEYKEVQCPHCGKRGKGGIMKRWHFEKCSLLSVTKV